MIPGGRRASDMSVVVVDVPGVHDDADPELAVRAARVREAGIAAVGEPVAAARADSR